MHHLYRNGGSSFQNGSRRIRNAFRTIQGKLFLLLLVVLVPIIVVQLSIYSERLSTLRKMELQSNLEMARAVAESFSHSVQEIVRQEQMIGSIFAPLGPPTAEEVRPLFNGFKSTYGSFQSLVWIDPRGVVVGSSDATLIGTNESAQPCFKEIAAGRNWSVSQLFRTKEGKAAFAVGCGIREKGVLVGIVAANVDADELENLFAVKRFSGGDITLIDKMGRAVYRYPEVQWTWEKRDLKKTYSNVDRPLSGQEVAEITSRTLDGEKRFLAMAPIRGIGWAAAASRVESEAVDPVFHQILQNAALFFLAVLGSFAAALFISRRISTSVGQLHRHALTLRAGRWPDRIDVKGAVELKELGEIFNSMTEEIHAREEALRKARDDLDLQVQERTAELREANASLREYARELEVRNKELADFTFISSHDLQEPLRKIQIFSDMIKSRYENLLDEQGSDYLNRMSLSAGKMQDLIHAVRDYSMLISRSEPFKRVDLNKACRDAVRKSQALIEATGAEVQVGELPIVEAEENQMRLLFEHLLANALKYRKEIPPIVSISSRRLNGGKVEIAVEDNGIGFDDAKAEVIFKPFRRLHGQGDYAGTGMGLAICRKIVESHGGAITAHSLPGRGSTFIIDLPDKLP